MEAISDINQIGRFLSTWSSVPNCWTGIYNLLFITQLSMVSSYVSMLQRSWFRCMPQHLVNLHIPCIQVPECFVLFVFCLAQHSFLHRQTSYANFPGPHRFQLNKLWCYNIANMLGLKLVCIKPSRLALKTCCG